MSTTPLDLTNLILFARNDDGKDPVHKADAAKIATAWMASVGIEKPVGTVLKKTTLPTKPVVVNTTPTNIPTVPVTNSKVTWTKPYWLGGWSGNVQDTVKSIVASAGSDTALLVAYNIPGRDNGNYSAGGLRNASEYSGWIQQIAAGIGSSKALIVLEPDALGLSHDLSESDRNIRYTMLQNAIVALKQNGNTKVYIDSSIWSGVDGSVSLLNKLMGYDGFSCNVSGYLDLNACLAYAQAVNSKTSRPFIIDTSRNGNGAPHGSDIWCNQTDTKIGQANTANPVANCDAYLWIKVPGESDGKKINGKDGDGKPEVAPVAGTPWPEFREAIYSGNWVAFKKKYNV